MKVNAKISKAALWMSAVLAVLALLAACKTAGTSTTANDADPKAQTSASATDKTTTERPAPTAASDKRGATRPEPIAAADKNGTSKKATATTPKRRATSAFESPTATEKKTPLNARRAERAKKEKTALDGKRGASQREMLREKRLLPEEQRAAARRLAQKRTTAVGALAKAMKKAADARAARAGQVAEGGTPLPLVEANRAVITGPIPGCPDCGLPGGTPDYFSRTPNWAFSPLPKGSLFGIDVIETGSGYTAPTVLIEDLYGNGTGAAATVEVIDGLIAQVTLTNPGVDYVAPVASIIDDTGTGAVVEVSLDPSTLTGGLRKFVDTLPGLGPDAKGNLDTYIPVAVPDIVTYPGSDYYEIELHQYEQRMHSDLPNATTLRGYVQVNRGTDTSLCGGAEQPACGAEHNVVEPPKNQAGEPQPYYLGPLIVSQKDRPVRIKFTNKLPTGQAGNLFIPVDTTVMGSGLGPDGVTMFPQNRADVHLHGGRTPWISDGTAHQWWTPAGETAGNGDPRYLRGESYQNVPDMPDPGPGAGTLYYTNQQSARMLFYHDHASGITRLNVYVGEAAGYLIRDDVENQLVADGIIPAAEVPLVIQTKTFVDANTIAKTDPTWDSGTGPLNGDHRAPKTGDFWWPHVYMPAENPFDMTGVNATGRWVYGPWFWPPTPVCSPQTPPPACVVHGAIPNPWYQTACEMPVPDPTQCTRPWEPPEIPGTPSVSWAAEAFLDTPIVNGVAYPTVTLDPKPYRFRMLNADHDRFFNFQLYVADPAAVTPDGRQTEVAMVAAANNIGLPANWPQDGRAGGVPDPAYAGPDWVVIGSEGGFLPSPVTVPSQPIVWNTDPTMFNVGNVEGGSLMLAPAERADVIVDFSNYAGQTLILYNDAPAPWPALDPHYDYYTGLPDNTAIGSSPAIYPGYGPNTRTVMQIKISQNTTGEFFDPAPLESAFASKPGQPSVFERGQDPIIAGQVAYNSAYGVTFPGKWPYWGVARISDTGLGFQTVQEAKAGTWPPRNRSLAMHPKAIHDEMGGVFDEYGRLSAKLGIEIFGANAQNQNFVMQGYSDPTTEILNPSDVGSLIGTAGDGTQIWKVTHNGVDTHPIHFHLFDVQLINRVGWDGFIRLPEPTELGWKETVRISPLEDTIVALRPVVPMVPFGQPNSRRHLNPALPEGSPDGFMNLDPVTGNGLATPTTNILADFGWEYTWHCHILSHEENDMMRPISFMVTPLLPGAPTGVTAGEVGANPDRIDLGWIDATPPATSVGDLSNEIGFKIERSTNWGATFTQIGTALANATSFNDLAAGTNHAPLRYRIRAYNAAGDAVSEVVAPVVLPDPTITSVVPNSGEIQGGVVVTITGTNFYDGATVTFGGTAATSVTFVDATTLSATTPAHLAGIVDVVVTNPDAKTATLAGGFTYGGVARIDSVTPTSGPTAGGTAVTIAGANFVPGATVSFGGTAATNVAVVNDATITATTPAHAAGLVGVAVTNPASDPVTSANAFTYYAPPAVTGVTPPIGPTNGGTAVVIGGSAFRAGATVSFGGTAATNVVVVSETQITATTPAHAAGAVDVVVTNSDGQAGSLAAAYTYANFDLTVSALTAPTGIGVNVPFVVTDTIAASGAANSPATVTYLYLSRTAGIDNNSILLGTRAVAAINTGRTNRGSTTVTIPVGTAPGNYFIVALADGAFTAGETNENNNTRSSAISVGPDLVVSALRAPNRANAGSLISITDTTNNVGRGGATATVTGYYLSSSMTPQPNDVLLGTRNVPAIAAAGSNSGTVGNIRIPAGTAAGRYYIIAVANYDNAIGETSTGNNSRSTPITIN